MVKNQKKKKVQSSQESKIEVLNKRMQKQQFKDASPSLNESVIAPVTPDEFENGLFFMPTETTLILVHLNKWDSNEAGYINQIKGNDGWEEFFTEDSESHQAKLKSGFSIVNMRLPRSNSKETDFRTLVLGLKKPYKQIFEFAYHLNDVQGRFTYDSLQ